MKKGLIILLSCVAVGGVAVAAVALTEHKHTAGDWVVDQEATCTQEGKRHQACEKCGETLTEEAIPVKEHRFSSWKVTREATCTEEEVSERACTSCGLKEASYAPAKGHAYSDEVILQEPDCAEPGKKTFSCSVCGLNGAEEAIPALGHVLVQHLPVSADCTNDGIIGHWSCDRCGGFFADAACTHKVKESDLVVAALGHKVVHHDAKASQCTATGNIEYWTCSRCYGYFKDKSCTKAITVPDTITSALGHSSVYHKATDPYCATQGNTEHWTCSRCSLYFSDKDCKTEIDGSSTVIAALGHDTAQHAPISPDCTNAGQIGYWSCNRCSGLFADAAGDHKLTQADLAVDALGHQAVKHPAVAVSCTTDGSIEYWTCHRCSKFFGNEKCTAEITEASTVIPHGHVSSHIAAKAATCTVDGNIEYWKCTRCNSYYSDSSLTEQITQAETVIAKLGHDTTLHDAVAETCTSDGNIKYWHCNRCNKNYSDSSYANEVSSKQIIIKAHHTGTYTCTICGYHGTYTIGSYPQTQVTNETKIAALNALAGDDPIAGNATSGNWTAYAYYAGDSTEGSEVITYFMYYQDITYQGLKYRGVYITAWKPYFTYYPLNHSYHHQTGYSLNTVYWFKYEPINWVVLSETSTELFLLADKALDSQQAHHAQANNYATSDIWTFINSTFYNTAFSSSEKAKLVTNEDGDKISLLTSEDALNPAYGFDDFTNARDEARKRYGTDYAISQGLYITSTRLCGGWILKTLYPPFWVSGQFGVCSWAGQVANNWAHSSSMGVVPVIIVSR